LEDGFSLPREGHIGKGILHCSDSTSFKVYRLIDPWNYISGYHLPKQLAVDLYITECLCHFLDYMSRVITKPAFFLLLEVSPFILAKTYFHPTLSYILSALVLRILYAEFLKDRLPNICDRKRKTVMLLVKLMWIFFVFVITVGIMTRFLEPKLFFQAGSSFFFPVNGWYLLGAFIACIRFDYQKQNKKKQSYFWS
jgi:hypothetical protein